MRMLKSWQIKIPNMNKMRQKTNEQLHTQDVRTDIWSNKHEKGYNSRKNQPSVKSVSYVHAQIMANQDTKYELNQTKDK